VQAGDRILLYTDGLSEATSPESDEEFGENELQTLLKTLSKTQGDCELANLRDALIEGAVAFSGGPLLDDCTLMVGEVR
jgi:phosphoserine phosphatase RsbU/P